MAFRDPAPIKLTEVKKEVVRLDDNKQDKNSSNLTTNSKNIEGAINELKTKSDTLTSNSALKSTQIIAGNGLQGGGTLEQNRTLSIKGANDSITTSSSGLAVNTYNGVNSTSTTRPVSANALKTTYDKLVTVENTANSKLSKAGDTMSGNISFSNQGTSFVGLKGSVGDDDGWRIAGGSKVGNVGELEIATGFSGNQPIYVRQYNGTNYSTIARTLTLLDANGNTTFPGTLTASRISGALTGNASTATALQTARTINGTSFNGTANITTANWGTARTLTIGNSGKSVNGSANISWSLSEIGAFGKQGEVTSSTNWNNLRTPGVYKVQLSGWGDVSLGAPNNAFSSLYSYGILHVYQSNVSHEERTTQVYYPHNSSNSHPIVTRMYNGSVWNSWSKLGRGLTYTDVGAAASSHTHTISNLTDLRIRNSVSSCTTNDPTQGWASSEISSNAIIFGGHYTNHSTTSGNIVFCSGNGKINMVIDGEYYASEGKNKVYHAGNKPTPSDIGAFPTAGGTITGNIEFSNITTGTKGITGTIGGNDFWRIIGGSTAENSSYLEIATADDGNEPIYVRQYSSGKFVTLARTATLLDASGNTSFPVKVTAPTFVGALSGNASTATKLQTPRTINGTNFDGSTAITTANWGTARTLTIGNTGKSINGSANVSWSLSEIGAAPSSHTHNNIVSRGNVTAESGVAGRPAVSGLSMSQAYNNGYPYAYGNVISLRGTGDGQIFVGWSGTDGGHAPVYIRSKRDNTSTAGWSSWAQVYTSSYPQPSVSGNAGTATALQTARTINGTSFNGSANITTANWGTARTLTIGASSQSINGSANYTYSHSAMQVGRAYSHSYSYGGNQNAITTAAFITILTNLGAFSQPYWCARGSWSYASNQYINDTGCGNIHLAGCTVEVMGSSSAYTVRIHTPTTSASGVSNGDFIYVNNGSNYSPGWRRLYNTKYKPSAADVGALATSGGTISGNLTVTGAIVANGNVTAYSDRKLKANITKIENALDKICSIGGYTFDMLGTGQRQTGVIAQELEKVLPEAVIKNDNGYLSVDYGRVVGLLIEGIKDLKQEIDELKGGK